MTEQMYVHKPIMFAAICVDLNDLKPLENFGVHYETIGPTHKIRAIKFCKSMGSFDYELIASQGDYIVRDQNFTFRVYSNYDFWSNFKEVTVGIELNEKT